MNKNKFKKITYICLILMVTIVALISILLVKNLKEKTDIIQPDKSENVRIINRYDVDKIEKNR